MPKQRVAGKEGKVRVTLEGGKGLNKNEEWRVKKRMTVHEGKGQRVETEYTRQEKQ